MAEANRARVTHSFGQMIIFVVRVLVEPRLLV